MIIFENAGLIDMGAVTTMGACVKEGRNPIGFFGTGLKYAIAVCLRHECSVTLYRGTGRVYKFSAVEKKIRGKKFDVVHMNGKPLGYTTELGKHWQLWMAFRELWCNAVDEGGLAVDTTGPNTKEVMARPHKTKIVVEGKEFDWAYQDRNQFIIERDRAPWVELRGVQVFKEPSKYLFYRGIRAYELTRPSMFTYNIVDHQELTEDRTLRWYFSAENKVRNAIMDSPHTELIEAILLAPKEDWEAKFDFKDEFDQQHPSREFVGTAVRLNSERGRYANLSAVNIAREHMRREMKEEDTYRLEGVQGAVFEKAKSFCFKLGYDMDKIRVIVVDALDGHKLSQVLDDKLFISTEAVAEGTRAVVREMIVGHIMLDMLSTKDRDEEVETSVANYLLQRVITLGEKLAGEPL